MHFSGLDLNLLVALDSLIAEKNISRTGERIHLSQSATSGALARLREYFKDDLLVPMGRKMVLTPLAEELAQPVRQLLMQAEAIIHHTSQFVPVEAQRKFRIVMTDYVVTVLMSQVAPILEKEAPGVSIEIITPRSRRDELNRGEADLVIMPRQYLSPAHPVEPLFSDGFACLVCAGNRSARNPISMRTYMRLGHVAVRFGERQEVPGFEQGFLELFGHHRRIEMTAPTFALVPQLIIGTTRVATIYRRLALYYATHFPLRVLRPPVEIPAVEEAMQWHTNRGKDPGLRWLRGVFRSGIKNSAV